MMTKQNTLYRDLTLSDAFEQQAAQNWLPLDVIQLSSGTYQGQLREITRNDVSVCFEKQNCMVHKRAIMPEPFCTVSYVRSPNGNARVSEHNLRDDSLFFIPSGSEIDIQIGADVKTVYFRINQQAFLERARIVSPQKWGHQPKDVLNYESSARQALEAFSHYLYANPPSNSRQGTVEDGQISDLFIMDKLLLALDSSTNHHDMSKDLTARYRAKERVYQALDYIHGELEQGTCLSIVDICVKINISQRNLQYSFKKILGITPNVYLYHLRLNRARAQLKQPANAYVTVTDVATHWKFWHLGRFANDYLKLFGELPSVTLTQALKFII